jgi:hypothetical protein
VAVGAYVLFTHPGFQLPNAFGWLDETGFFSNTVTGDLGYSGSPGVWGAMTWGSGTWGAVSSAGGTVIGNLSSNVLNAGWRPGLLITDQAGLIPAGTRIAGVSDDGLSISLTQSTTGAVTGDVLTVQGGTPTAPLWNAGNTNGFPLPGVAVAVSQFNGRAEFAVGSSIAYSDSLDPLQRSNANQALTFDNGRDVTAFATIPFSTTAGGIIQSLLAFQADAAIQQITGDPATQNLAKNLLAEIGTLAPNSIVSTPEGVLFIAPDGLRAINQTGSVTPPVGTEGDGVALPFVNALNPSRMAASYNEDVYRVSVSYNVTSGGSAISQTRSAEFWFHLKAKAWSGPHSFPANLIAPLDLSETRHGHVMFPMAQPGEGWFSNTRPMIDSTYRENGADLYYLFQTSLLPDTETMFMNGMNETTVMMSLPPTGSCDVAMVDEAGNLLDHLQIEGFTPAPAKWGSMVWGAARWGGAPPPPGLWGQMQWGSSTWGDTGGGALISQRLIPWDHELVFKQASLLISGKSAPGVAIGNVYMRYQITGYTITDLANVSS